jgi:hypothetical protein
MREAKLFRVSSFGEKRQMALNRRLVLAATLVALLVGASAALAAWSHLSMGEAGAGAFAVEVVGPDGPLFAGTVRVDEATALTLLEAAAHEAGLALELQEYPGMGTYVRAVGTYRADGAAGWVYEVQRDGRWMSGDRSAAHYPLQEGQALRWKWVDDGA